MGLFFVISAQQFDPKGMQQDIPFVPVKYQGESTGSESKINISTTTFDAMGFLD